MNNTFKTLLDETVNDSVRANALRGAFLWGDATHGFEFWQDQHAGLLHGNGLSSEAIDIIKTIALLTILRY